MAAEIDRSPAVDAPRVVKLRRKVRQRIRRVAGVAGGTSKREAIRAAIEGKLVNVLVTDHITAQHLLKP